MPRKPRPEPIDEGSIKAIFQWVFAPLVKHKPEKMDFHPWMESLFGLKTRDLSLWRVKRFFRIPGFFCPVPNMKVQGAGRRQVRIGAMLCTRMDEHSDEVTVEVLNEGHGVDDQIFSLTREQWRAIEGHLEEAIYEPEQ